MPYSSLILGLWSLMNRSTHAQKDLPPAMGAISLPPRDTSTLYKRTTQIVWTRRHRAAWILLCLGLNGSTVRRPASIP